jgi:hypothetical protein
VEKRRIDLSGAEVRVVNVALILQGIREGAAKRRKGSDLSKSLESQRVIGLWLALSAMEPPLKERRMK